MTRRLLVAIGLCLLFLFAWRAIPAQELKAVPPDTVMIEDLTWVELRTLMRAGKTTVIVPTGGVEQNGPHMVLGKHDYIVRYTSEAIARRLGNAVVAPVVAYVPEGRIDPPQGHMQFPGSISLPDDVYAGLLDATARSFAVEGFKAVVFLGDSGGNQAAQAEVARRLDLALQPRGVRVLQVDAYYAGNGGADWLKSQGYSAAEVDGHAAIRDTSELLAIHPEGVRADRIAAKGGLFVEPTGVQGDPSRASAEIGRKLLAMKIDAAVQQITRALGNPQ